MPLLLALYIFYHCLYCWLGRPHCICSEQISIGKRPNYLKPSGFPCYILNNTHFFWNQSRKSENFYGLKKVGTWTNKMIYPEGTFLWWGLFIPSFKTIAYVDYKRSDMCRRWLLLQGLCVPSAKTTTCVCNRFSTSFCARNHKTNQPIWNLNRKFWNKSAQKIKSTTSLTDLFLKCLYKSIYANSYYALFVIIVTGCDVLSNEISFLTPQRGGGIARVNYLKVKNDVTYRNTIFSDKNQIHTLRNFCFYVADCNSAL